MSERSLLDAEDVKRWHDNLTEGSPRTAEEYLRWLADYCSWRQVRPVEVISEFTQDKKAAQDRLEDYIRSLKARGLRPRSMNSALCAVKSWLRFNELAVTRQIKVGNLRSAPTIENEHPPSPEELRAVLDHANQRTRAAIVLIAFSGIRPEAISRLKLSDLPEPDVNGEIQALMVPMLVRVRAELSKNRRPFFTFIGRRGIECLTAYLRERRAEGEILTLDSPVIAVSRTLSIKNKFMASGIRKEKGTPMGRKAIRFPTVNGRTPLPAQSFWSAAEIPVQGASRRDYAIPLSGRRNRTRQTYRSCHSQRSTSSQEATSPVPFPAWLCQRFVSW